MPCHLYARATGKPAGRLHLWWAPLTPHPENHRLNASRWKERKRRWGGNKATRKAEGSQAWWEERVGIAQTLAVARRHRFVWEAA